MELYFTGANFLLNSLNFVASHKQMTLIRIHFHGIRDHSKAIWELLFNSFKTKSRLLLHTKGAVPSAKLQTLQSKKTNMSIKYMLNSKGSIIDPCSML